MARTTKDKPSANGPIGASTPPAKQRGNRGNVAESSLAALARYQFPPGVSGNPAGRPKRKTVSEYFADLLERSDIAGLEIPPGECGASFLAERMFREACEGKFPFAKEILDRTEGKVPDRHAGHDGGPLIDLTRLDDRDLDHLEAIYKKLNPPAPIDVTGEAGDDQS